MSKEEIDEIRDELRVYKEQLDIVREDLRIVVKYGEDLRHAILHMCNQQGNPNLEVEIPRLKEFRDKYDICERSTGNRVACND